MNAAIQDFGRFLEAQRREFRLDAPRRVAEIESLWRSIARGTPPPAGMERLERHAHSLAGTAGTFGLAALGRDSSVLERAVQRRDPAAIAAAVSSLASQLPP